MSSHFVENANVTVTILVDTGMSTTCVGHNWER